MNAKMRDIVIGILTSTMMIFIGYGLNDYLSRDRISIESVEFEPEMSELTYRTTTPFQRLMQNRVFLGWLGFSKSKDEGAVFDQEHKDGLSAYEARQVAVILKQFLEFEDKSLGDLKKIDANMMSTPSKVNEDALIKQAKSLFLFESTEYYPNDLKTWSKNISARIKASEEAKDLAHDILSYVQNFKSIRTGGLWIHITFLNSGNTDGLIRSEGNLELEGRPEHIPIILDDDKGPAIGKRSIVALYFRCDEANAVSAQLQTFRALIQQGGNLSGSVTVNDFRRSLIHSGKFAFPVIESNP